jgi:hypothetical protein
MFSIQAQNGLRHLTVFGHARAVHRELCRFPGAEAIRLRLHVAVVHGLRAAFIHWHRAQDRVVLVERLAGIHVQTCERLHGVVMMVMHGGGRGRHACDCKCSESECDRKVFDRSSVPARRQQSVVRCHFHSLVAGRPSRVR